MMDKEIKDEMLALCDEHSKALCILKNRFEFRKDQTEDILKRIDAALLSWDSITQSIRDIK